MQIRGAYMYEEKLGQIYNDFWKKNFNINDMEK